MGNVFLTDEELWKGVIHYGKNMSTYKMALGHLLIEYASQNRQKVSLDDLAHDFYHLYEKRLENGQRQNKSVGKNTYVEQEIWSVKSGSTNESLAYESIKQKALKDMVLQRFNSIQGKKIPKPFYSFDKQNLHLQDNLLQLLENKENVSLDKLIIGRWGLLEHAFTERDFGETLTVDERNEHFQHRTKRTNIAKFSDVINEYQDRKCFYCGRELGEKIQVDHVIPHKVVFHDEFWNLVLAHEICNQEKSDKMPKRRHIEKLIKRNEDILQSDLPIKENLKFMIGNTPEIRRAQIENTYKKGSKMHLGVYEPKSESQEGEFLHTKILRWFDQNER